MKPREFRKSRQMTLESLAEVLGVDASTLSRVERGVTRPGWDLMEKFREISAGAVTPNDFADLPSSPARAA